MRLNEFVRRRHITMRLPFACQALFVGLLLVVGWGSLSSAHATDWLRMELSFDLSEPPLLDSRQWLRFSLYADDYRAAITHYHRPSLARNLQLTTSVVVPPPAPPSQPYISAAVDLSLSEMTPPTVRMALHSKERKVVHIRGGLSYQLRPGLALTSRALFAQFNLVQVGLRVTF